MTHRHNLITFQKELWKKEEKKGDYENLTRAAKRKFEELENDFAQFIYETYSKPEICTCVRVKHNVKVESCPGRMSDKISEKLDDFIKDKPYDLVIHIGTSDLTNDVELLYNCCVLLSTFCESVQIWSNFWSVFSCIWNEYRKILTTNNSIFGPYLDTFQTKIILQNANRNA